MRKPSAIGLPSFIKVSCGGWVRWDLTSSVHGKVEVVWQGTAIPASLRALGAECHVTRDTVRAMLSEANQDAAIDALRRERLRLVSVTPVRTSLEDYYLQKLQPASAPAGAGARAGTTV